MRTLPCGFHRIVAIFVHAKMWGMVSCVERGTECCHSYGESVFYEQCTDLFMGGESEGCAGDGLGVLDVDVLEALLDDGDVTGGHAEFAESQTECYR